MWALSYDRNVLKGIDMNTPYKSSTAELQRCSVVADSTKIKFRPLSAPIFSILEYAKPKGIYTNSYKALYSGTDYEIALRIQNYNWIDKDDDFNVLVQNGSLLGGVKFDKEQGFLLFKLRTDNSRKFGLQDHLPDSLWDNLLISIVINGITIRTEDAPTLLIPFCNTLNTLTDGRDFIHSDNMFLPLYAEQDLIFEMVSGGGGGGPSSLVKGETIPAERGGHMCLFLLAPDTDEIIPLVALEGGLAGEAVEGAYGKSKKKKKVISVNRIEERTVFEYATHQYAMEAVVEGSHMPENTLTDVKGAIGYTCVDDIMSGSSGDGVIVPDVGYRGTAGSSGQKATIIVRPEKIGDIKVGPLLIINPLANLAAKGYLKEYKFDLSQQAYVAGLGGYSPAGSGEHGQEGALLIKKGNYHG